MGIQIEDNISESEILYLRFRRAMPKKTKIDYEKIFFYTVIVIQAKCK